MYRLETFDFTQYQELSDFLGFRPQLLEHEFNRIRVSRPGGKRGKSTMSWSRAELEQFCMYVSPLAERLGYEVSETVKGGGKLDHRGGGKLDHLAAGRSS